MKALLPPEEFYASLPTKRMAAGVLFFDAQERVLLVHPTYKSTWEIPGGVVEKNESPRAGAQREILEELGLIHPIGRLLIVDYNDAVGVKTESLMFIFDGGILTMQEVEAIHLQADELNDFAFFEIADLPEAMTDTLSRRVRQAYQEHQRPQNAYRENQA